ncbi:MAG: hypothetical protein LBH25_13745 [Fibromonadaceae bacterium]|jgi:hypothetical protein|nr:hypothetical protein [Fibromonadaceae bacterium]
MSYSFQLGRRSKNEGGDDFLPSSDQDEELDEFDDIGEGEEEEDVVEDEEALDEELDFDKPHFRRLGLDYEEEEDE